MDNINQKPHENLDDTTDPQEKMTGPISSLVNKVADAMEAQPMEESDGHHTHQTFAEVKGTDKENAYRQALSDFLANNDNVENEQNILDNPDQYVVAKSNEDGTITISWKD